MKRNKTKKSYSSGKKLQASTKSLNPFEIHINRKKHNIVGQRSKNEKGLPGIARSRAIKKRKATLLEEYKIRGKSNMFVDRRIGEKDSTMTMDDKITARYTTERMRFHSKKSLYNLDDNEVLTHKGESLADIEKFDEPFRSDDEDDEGRETSGKLSESFVSGAHFGGGMLKRVEGDSMSRKDLIDQMIAESKIRKAEQQQLREQTLNLTEKLDSEWNDIQSLVHCSKPREEASTLPSDKKYISYDRLSKELKFESRGKATDKLKSENELVKEEKKKLEELERQRLSRMQGDIYTSGPKHRSADDLDDGFDYSDNTKSKKKVSFIDEDEGNDFQQEASHSDEDVSDSDDDNDDKTQEEEDQGENESSEDSEETDDDLADLKDDSEEEIDSEISIKTHTRKVSKPVASAESLPFTLKVPDTYDEFYKLLDGRDKKDQGILLERIIKTNHPSAGGSRQGLINLYKYCLQHLQDTASDPAKVNSTFEVLDELSPWLYDLVAFSSATSSSLVSDVIKEKYSDYCKAIRRYPGLDTLVFFKLVSVLFSTSDYRHRIATPTMLFMQQILTTCKINRSTDVAIGLFVVTLILEFTAVSKRFTPEAINFIKGCLRSAQPNENLHPTVPPFKSRSEYCLSASLNTSIDSVRPLQVSDLTTATASNEFKVSALNLALRLLDDFCKNFQNGEDYLVMEPFVPLLQLDNFPSCLHPTITRILSRISILKQKKLYKLVAEKKRPKPLRLYEPKIEEVYTFRKKKPMSQEKEEHEKLMYKYKKEVKGALREIRRDNAFLSNLKLTETKASDIERKRKVKEILGDAAQQAGEIKKLKRVK